MNTPTHTGSTAWLRHLLKRDRIWRLVDANDQVLGRLASQIATVLQGKNKPHYLDNTFSGDPVVVINARHITLTGRKPVSKVYLSHSGYPGGLKRVPLPRLMERRPDQPIRRAVFGMLPRNRLRRIWMENLHVYPDAHHPHDPQNPQLLPPNHLCTRLRTGGPPTYDELALWWEDVLCKTDDDRLAALIAKARSKGAPASRGLAELLVGDDEDHTDAVPDSDALRQYLADAESQFAQPSVVVPPVAL